MSSLIQSTDKKPPFCTANNVKSAIKCNKNKTKNTVIDQKSSFNTFLESKGEGKINNTEKKYF